MNGAADESDGESTVRGFDTASGTDTDAESVASSRASDRNRKKKDKKKANKKAKLAQTVEEPAGQTDSAPEADGGVVVEYVSIGEEEMLAPELAELKSVFGHFTSAEELLGNKKEVEEEGSNMVAAADEKPEKTAEEEEAEARMSRKQKKKLKRLSVAELKQLVSKPDVVEQWDVTAQDPRLLVHLKSCRNTIPVPKHWAQKRKFLQGKRGVEKPPFQLPDFIQATGIEKIRASVLEREQGKKLKGKQKERMQPKMGKIDIDYQVLHDAFFKFQTKPRLTRHGDTYYEGKEHEVALREKKPGHISEDLAAALQIPDGGPPPWLINMQRYGPPPSYPNLKIPGLNAPIPAGASYGYHPGGWGKPPVDEFGRPLYGDVFGTAEAEAHDTGEVLAQKELWGQMEAEEDVESEEDEDEDEDGGAIDDSVTDEDVNAGISSVSSMTPSGIDTPDSLHLRKMVPDGMNTPSGSVSGMDTPDSAPPALYQVLEQQNSKVGGSAFGSAHTYQVPSAKSKPAKAGGVEVALDPSELEKLDEASLKAKYDELQKAQKEANAPEDVSDIIEEQERKRRRKMEAQKGGDKNYKF